MTPNLRSLVAKAYRVRQGRAFCFSSASSSAPNPIGDKDVASTIAVWSTVGYVLQFGWEISRILKIKRKSDIDTEIYKIEMERFREKLRRKLRELSEE